MARGILILSGNRLLKHDLQLGIVLCQDHLVGAMLWGGPRMCKQNGTIIFRNSFQKNQFRALYIARTAQISERISKFGAFWDTIWHNAIFVGEIFQVFLWREIRKNILGNYFLTSLNFIPSRKFAISLYFSSSKNAVSDRFCRLKICNL